MTGFRPSRSATAPAMKEVSMPVPALMVINVETVLSDRLSFSLT